MYKKEVANILLVEDDDIIANELMEVFEQDGYGATSPSYQTGHTAKPTQRKKP